MINPPVSVIVVTYNSARFVLETLESVLLQTWKEMELIVTDDCSQDNTVDLCRDWLAQNNQRFVRTKLLTANQNHGVSANVNRGLKAANGEWMSFVAGDDTLKITCIEDNMKWLESHHEIRILFSSVEIYNQTFEPRNLLKTTPESPYLPESIMAPGRSAQSQYNMLLLSDRIHYTPSLFLNRQTLLSVGGFDERFRLQEDYPLWLNLTRNGHKLYFMDKVTVNYRRHINALNNTGVPSLINPNYYKEEQFRRIYTYPNLPTDIRLNQRYKWLVLQLFRSKKLNRNVQANRFLRVLLTLYLNPFEYFLWLKKRLNASVKESEFYQ